MKIGQGKTKSLTNGRFGNNSVNPPDPDQLKRRKKPAALESITAGPRNGNRACSGSGWLNDYRAVECIEDFLVTIVDILVKADLAIVIYAGSQVNNYDGYFR